jgi:hypothetical protein
MEVKDMKKALVVLLVIGLLIGASGFAVGTEEGTSQENLPVLNENTSLNSGISPCGGGGGSGGGAPG